MSENDSPREDAKSAVRRPSIVRATAHAALLAAFFAAGAAAVEAVIAVYSGSYLPWSVYGMVTAFWSAAAIAAVFILSVVLLPLTLPLRGGLRAALLPSVVLAGGFAALSLVVKQTIAGRDSLGGEVLLNWVFLSAWGAALAAVTAVTAAKSRRAGAATYFASAASIVVAAGMSYFVWAQAAAFTLVIAPLGLFALGGAILDRIRTAKGRAVALVGIFAVYAIGLLVTAQKAGEAPLEPIDRHFRADPGKTAMLAGKPNVVIIVLDTVRADHTSLCGYKHPTTPNLDGLAAECRLFPYGESVDSWTLPAHASMFTGKYPREHGAHADSKPSVESIEKWRPYGIPLAASQVTLATLLSMKGYDTGAIVANYSWLCRQYGMDQGFSYYYDLPRMLLFTDGGSPIHRYGMEAVDRLLGKNGKLLQPYWSARAVTKMAERWTRRNSGSPFFLFLNYMDPHYPYSAPPPFDKVDGPDIPYDMRLRQRPWQDLITRYINTGKGFDEGLARSACNQYDGEIAYTDFWVGQLVEWFKKRGLWDDTLVVITSDHGEFLGEHQLLNHGTGIYEGGIRVPILVKYPGGRHAGEVRNERVSIIDIYATVLDVLQLPKPAGVPAIPLGAPGRPVYTEDFENGMNVKRYGERFKGDRTGCYDGDWKYMDSTVRPDELYNLATDADERKDLSKLESQIAGEMLDRIRMWREATPVFDGTKAAGRRISPAELEKLKSLGYVGGED